MSDLRSQLAALPPDKRKLLELLLQQEAELDQPQPSSAPTAFPLSFAQQRLWFLDQLEPGTPLYNLPVAMRLRGPLDLAALRRSFDLIAQRHVIIRATFALVAHQPVQRIAARLRVALPLVSLHALPTDLREPTAQQLVNDAARAPFDLATGPLLRTLVLRLAEQEHVLLVTLHHSISDGWSGGVLLRELMTFYTAAVADLPAPLPPLPMQYTDYVVWQREQLQGAVLERQLAYWRHALAGVAALQLPTDHARPNAASTQTASVPFALTSTLTGALKQLSQRANGTLFMTMLAGFAALLARYSGQDDICIGSLVANRNRAEVERLIGFFVNNLALRVDLSGEPAVEGLLRRVREVTLGAYDHQDVPFEQVIEALQPARRMSHTPLFQVMCALQNFPVPQQTLTTLRLSPFKTESRHSGFDLALWLREAGSQLVGELEYRPDLFDQSTVLRVVRHLQTLVQGMVTDPAGRVLDLPLLTNTERHQLLVEWNDSAADVSQVNFSHLFAAQLARRPDAIAIVCGAEQLSYHDLHQRAERLSGVLREHGIGSEALVAVFAARGVAFLIAILAVFKAGAAYLPLDPRYPPQRIGHMLEQSGAALVLTTPESHAALTPVLARRPADQQPPIISITTALGRAASTARPLRDAGAPALAYVIYTSGSTGMPKGAMVEQRGMCNHLHAKIADLRLTAADRIAQTASQCFDISVWQFLAGLVVGGQVHVIPDAIALDPPRLLEQVARARISILETVPSLLQALLDERVDAVEPLDLRWLIPTGEALAPELCRRWLRRYPAIPLLNAYGPTECSDDVACYAIAQPPSAASTTPIGRAVANMCLYVLGPRLQPMPIGCAGELYVGGVGVGRGYLNQPDLTAERFVPNPFAEVSGIGYRVLGAEPSDTRYPIPDTRLYKTGDLARYAPNGLITFLGRIDGQVKLRGFRIELGEIEALLTRHPAVRQAVVLAREVSTGDTRLVAYVVPTKDERRRTNEIVSVQTQYIASVRRPSSTIPELRTFLQQHLPDYMLPSAFVLLDALPLMPNGKLDRRALPLPDPTNAAHADTFVAPRTPIEQALARVWAEVLRLERVGVEDNFFTLGGHSLLATQIVARVRSTFDVELPLRALFEAPTVAGLALRIASAQRSTQDHPPPSDPLAVRVAPLSFAQQRLWFLDQLQPGLPNYNLAIAIELRGALDVAALAWSFNEVVRRHAVLRTTFAMLNEQPAQLIAAALTVPLALIDLREHDRSARRVEVQCRAAAEARHAFDLARGPLLRTSLLQLDAQTHVLLLNLHHIIADGWSLGVLIRELAALYSAAATGRPTPLPALPIQYADYAIEQREWLAGADDPHTPSPLQTQLAYWRRQLADLPTLALPTDRPRPAVLTNRGARCRFQVPRALSDALTTRSQAEGVTLFMTLLATFQLVLARHSGQDDIVVGTPIAGRTRRETEGLIGFFVNTLVMRTDLRGNPTLRELLGRVRASSLDAFAHQDLPFELLVERLQPARELNRAPLFQVLFVLQNAPLVLDMPGLRLRTIDIEPESAKFDMSLSVTEMPQGLSCVWEYATDLFEAATIMRLCAYFQALLVGLIADPDQRLAELVAAADAGWRAHMQLEYDLADLPLAADDAQVIDLLDPRVPRSPARIAPLSFAQQRLWFLDQLQLNRPGAVIAAAVQLTGALHIAALEASFAMLIQRHAVLRTTFGHAHGRPVQRIASATALYQLPLRLLDLSGLQSASKPLVQCLADAAAQQRFDLSSGPLLRATLLRLGSQAHVLLLTLHPIIADGWSIGIFLAELAALYDAFNRQQPAQLPELPLQYADYAIMERARLHEEVRAAQLDYWRDALAGASPLLELPFDHPRPPVQRPRVAQQSHVLPAALGAALRALGEWEACTLFETLLAAFVLLLYRYTGQADIVVGTPTTGRTSPELAQLIGHFSNPLALRTRLSDDLSFAALLERTRLVSRAAHAHQELPFELLIEALQPTHDFSRAPLFQVLFQTQRAPLAIALPDLALRLLPITSETTPFDLALALTETDAGLLATCSHTPDLFDHTTITRLLGHFQTLLHGCVAEPGRRAADLPLLTAAERAQLLHEWNDTQVVYPRDAAVHALFEAQAARSSDAVAVVFDFRDKQTSRQADKQTTDRTTNDGSAFSVFQMTYRELNARANQLAHYLQARGVGADTLLALCAERSLAMLVGILGILKAGGAYVPLDPTYPIERLAFMLEDTQAKVLVTDQSIDDLRFTIYDLGASDNTIVNRKSKIVNLCGDWSMLAGYPTDNPASGTSADSLAYVIYTSGSTGRPKGVMNSHGAIVNRLLWMQEAYGLAAHDAVLQKTPFTFDVSVWEFFWPLLVGARLILARPEGHKDSVYLVGLIAAQQITTLHFVPSMLRVFLEAPGLEACASVQRIICSGEALPFALQQRCFARLDAQLHNLYGPTEAAVDVTYWACARDSQRAIVPIGRPIANSQIYLLDPRLVPTPIGVPGELYIGGVGLARGYVNRPDLTAERFVPNPFAEMSGIGYRVLGTEPSDTRHPTPDTRLYKTGDLARWLPDGAIEYLGRLDDQVKLRGFRIELGEIETLLARHPAVRACVVVARADVPGDTRLVAYVVTTNEMVAVETQNSASVPPIDSVSVETQNSASLRRPSSIGSELRAFLQQHLPEYMIPSAFVLLDALPKTPNGKLDRRALPAPDLSDAPLETAYVAPRTPTEGLLADMWAQVLRREHVGIHDNFFALGGHSLLATQLLYRLREAFQVELTLHTVFEAPTIAQLALLLHQLAAKHAPLVALQPHGDRLPLFCMPPGGGDLLCYAELARQLGPEQPFYALRAVGLDGATAPHSDVSAMAAYYLDALRQMQPHGPYLLAGWSLGGVVAYEMAQLLDAQGEAVALLAMIDPSLPQRTPTFQKPDDAALLAGFAQQFGLTPLVELEHQPDAQLRALLAQAQQAGLLPQTLTPAQLRQRIAVYAAHIQALQSYVPQRGPQHITLFQARERMEPEDADPATVWGALAADITAYIVPGDHYQILRPPYLQVLATQLRACLAALPELIESDGMTHSTVRRT